MDTELRKDTKDYKNYEIQNATNLLITTNTTNKECGMDTELQKDMKDYENYEILNATKLRKRLWGIRIYEWLLILPKLQNRYER